MDTHAHTHGEAERYAGCPICQPTPADTHHTWIIHNIDGTPESVVVHFTSDQRGIVEVALPALETLLLRAGLTRQQPADSPDTQR